MNISSGFWQVHLKELRFIKGGLACGDLAGLSKILIDRKPAQENQISSYAGWASKFIRFSNGRQFTPNDLEIQFFLDEKNKSPGIQGRQSRNKKPPRRIRLRGGLWKCSGAALSVG
ncbi:MAG: hypothetical protein K4445_09100 [Deltaproteobacteria bacterium]